MARCPDDDDLDPLAAVRGLVIGSALGVALWLVLLLAFLA